MIKNITLVAPLHFYSQWSYDTFFYNILIPLKLIGYNVNVYDPQSKESIEDFEKKVGTPDLLFCILTDSGLIDYISRATREGRFITYNLFCDDTWRFKDFSSVICNAFNAITTPERYRIEDYLKIGYKSVMDLPWPVSKDFYCNLEEAERPIDVTMFSRYESAHKNQIITNISAQKNQIITNVSTQSGLQTHYGHNESFEKMVIAMNKSKIVINSSIDNAGNSQMKMRMFEAAASGALLMTEDHKSLHNYFKLNQEFVTFASISELDAKVHWLLQHPSSLKKIAQKAHATYLERFEAKIVLKNLINWIMKGSPTSTYQEEEDSVIRS